MAQESAVSRPQRLNFAFQTLSAFSLNSFNLTTLVVTNILTLIAFALGDLFIEESACYLIGMTNGAYGDEGCNACVPDVEDAFNRASGSKDKRHDFEFSYDGESMNGETPDNMAGTANHIQGIVRLPIENNNWVAMSRSALD
ncbi:MAG: hypothetical protein SV375_23595, partial [Thermodesulfobacteriota bacterium]|nr:hypothetical protein [Thermodesulfobacteriota bacterium]